MKIHDWEGITFMDRIIISQVITISQTQNEAESIIAQVKNM